MEQKPPEGPAKRTGHYTTRERIEEFYDEDGKLEARILPLGTTEVFDEKGEVVYRLDRDGTKIPIITQKEKEAELIRLTEIMNNARRILKEDSITREALLSQFPEIARKSLMTEQKITGEKTIEEKMSERAKETLQRMETRDIEMRENLNEAQKALFKLKTTSSKKITELPNKRSGITDPKGNEIQFSGSGADLKLKVEKEPGFLKRNWKALTLATGLAIGGAHYGGKEAGKYAGSSKEGTTKAKIIQKVERPAPKISIHETNSVINPPVEPEKKPVLTSNSRYDQVSPQKPTLTPEEQTAKIKEKLEAEYAKKFEEFKKTNSAPAIPSKPVTREELVKIIEGKVMEAIKKGIDPSKVLTADEATMYNIELMRRQSRQTQ